MMQLMAVYAWSLWQFQLFAIGFPAVFFTAFMLRVMTDKYYARILYYIVLAGALLWHAAVLINDGWAGVVPQNPDPEVLDPYNVAGLLYRAAYARIITLLLLVTAPLWRMGYLALGQKDKKGKGRIRVA